MVLISITETIDENNIIWITEKWGIDEKVYMENTYQKIIE